MHHAVAALHLRLRGEPSASLAGSLERKTVRDGRWVAWRTSSGAARDVASGGALTDLPILTCEASAESFRQVVGRDLSRRERAANLGWPRVRQLCLRYPTVGRIVRAPAVCALGRCQQWAVFEGTALHR